MNKAPHMRCRFILIFSECRKTLAPKGVCLILPLAGIGARTIRSIGIASAFFNPVAIAYVINTLSHSLTGLPAVRNSGVVVMSRLLFLISVSIILPIACLAESADWLSDANAIVEREEQNLKILTSKFAALKQQQANAIAASNEAFSDSIDEKGNHPSLDRFKEQELKRIRLTRQIRALESGLRTSEYRVAELKKIMAIATNESNKETGRHSREVAKLKSKYTKRFAVIMAQRKKGARASQSRSIIPLLFKKLTRSSGRSTPPRPQSSIAALPDAHESSSQGTTITKKSAPVKAVEPKEIESTSTAEPQIIARAPLSTMHQLHTPDSGIGEQERQRRLARDERDLDRRLFAARTTLSRGGAIQTDESTVAIQRAIPQPKTSVAIESRSGGEKLAPAHAVKPITTSVPHDKILVIDDFDTSYLKNSLGNRTSVYERAPSTAMSGVVQDMIEDRKSRVLKLSFDKKSSGGPHGGGGWCGYYSVLKNSADGAYLDASAYTHITMWVRGENGDENFVIGLADKRWESLDDTVKSKQITDYLSASSLSSTWQKARIPLSEFSLDTAKLASFTIGFEANCFANGGGRGIVYIDDIVLEN